MEAGCPGRQAGSFAEIRIRLILYAKNCLVKRAYTAESTYVLLHGMLLRRNFGMNSFVY